MALVGNKSDLNDKRLRQVLFDEGRDLAKKNNMMFFETSTKDEPMLKKFS